MLVIKDKKEFAEVCRAKRFSGAVTALVPTMGYLHAGHASLLKYARENAGFAAASIFVNPTQFGPNEDLDAYPRNLEGDLDLARKIGLDAVFTPEAGSLYEPGHATWVEVPDYARFLCGQTRPIHFRGVCTVVSKLLHLALPTFAVFGEKDWQQLAILKRMALDLDLPTAIVGRPIVREADGLALSSRNVYLTPEERAVAPNIRQGLLRLAEAVNDGGTDVAGLKSGLTAFFAEKMPQGVVDYIEIVDPHTVEPLTRVSGPILAAVAVRLGKARLIDNILCGTATD